MAAGKVGEAAVLAPAHLSPNLHRGTNTIDDGIGGKRLLQEVERAMLHGFHSHCNVGCARDHKDRRGNFFGGEPAQDLKSRFAGKMQVENDTGGRCAANLLKKRSAVAKALRGIPLDFQKENQRFTYRRIIVDDENRDIRHKRQKLSHPRLPHERKASYHNLYVYNLIRAGSAIISAEWSARQFDLMVRAAAIRGFKGKPCDTQYGTTGVIAAAAIKCLQLTRASDS